MAAYRVIFKWLGDSVRSSIIAVLALSVAVSACDKKAEGQTVAIVNGEEVTAAELNAELAGANIPPGVNKDDARARVLQAMIDRRLLAQQAKKDGIDKSPEFLNRQRRATEDLLIKMLATRQIESAQLPSNQEVARFEASRPQMFAKREQWNLEQLRFAAPADPAVKAKIAAAKSLDELAAALSSSGVAFTRQKNRLDTGVIPNDLYGRLTTLPPNEPFVIPVGNMMVASVVTSREPAALAGEQARPIAVAAIRREQTGKFMKDRLQALRGSAKIEYKQGYAPPAAPAKK